MEVIVLTRCVFLKQVNLYWQSCISSEEFPSNEIRIKVHQLTKIITPKLGKISSNEELVYCDQYFYHTLTFNALMYSNQQIKPETT